MVLCVFEKTKKMYYKSKHISLLFHKSSTIRSQFSFLSFIKICSLKRYSIINIFNIKLKYILRNTLNNTTKCLMNFYLIK